MTRNIYALAVLLFMLPSSLLLAQNPGDTTMVQTFNYHSTTRDTVVEFPSDPNIRYEKVLMRYAMRCKDGLVSPPITGQTNVGCGEWDYSCNTYIMDSTRADSITNSIDRYQIYPDTSSTGTYSLQPTWQAYPEIQKLVTVQSTSSEDTARFGNGNLSDSSMLYTGATGGKVYWLFNATELNNAGLSTGNIDGLSFENQGSTALLKSFKIKMKEVVLTDLSTPDSTDFRGLQEVYFHNYSCTQGANRVQFHSPFNWSGTGNLLVELSYKGLDGNGKIRLVGDNGTSNLALVSQLDHSFEFIPGSYVEADAYQGIAGAGARTIEAWVKTSTASAEIVSWGRNSSLQKMTFRLDNGKLRMEINGGNVIGTMLVNDDQWHHVAMVLDGTSLQDVEFFVDGVSDPHSTLNNATINSDLFINMQVSKGHHNRWWNGLLDDVRVWSAALSGTTIADWRYRKLDASHPDYATLDVAYSVSGTQAQVLDDSPNANDGQFEFLPNFETLTGQGHFKEFTAGVFRPKLEWYQGTYTLAVSNDTLLDTVWYDPYEVIENTIFSRSNTIFSDSIGRGQSTYYPEYNIVYDLQGGIASRTAASSTTSLVPTVLPYYSRFPMAMEIMSFVTPYGINLDLGMEGKAWLFDVTDFLPVLNGKRRIYLTRGGQWQEDMDIQFYFIEGIPPRDVIDIQQIWKVDSRPYTNILNNRFFPPVTVPLDPNATNFKIRSAITGHGQEGEFIPRNHSITVNGGLPVSWRVWKECASNPVYPQGGTWIYDRAGWCPGMATDVREIDITDRIGASGTVTIDYGMSTASGNSNYIVNNQLVSYGSPNHGLDARILEVNRPSNRVEFARQNPICHEPEITVQNTGAERISFLRFQYKVNGGPAEEHIWLGRLEFLESATITLPVLSQAFWSAMQSTGNSFEVEITQVNGQADEYDLNNRYISTFDLPDVVPGNFVVQFRTNLGNNESSYDLRDSDGNVLFRRISMQRNTTYNDTFNLETGCFTLNVNDSGEDGLSFFANNDGNGSVIIREVGGGVVENFNPNFGAGIQYNFTVNNPLSLEQRQYASRMELFPNPASTQVRLELTGMGGGDWLLTDVFGKSIKKGLISGGSSFQTNIDLNDLPAGIYLVQAQREGVTKTKRLVVK